MRERSTEGRGSLSCACRILLAAASSLLLVSCKAAQDLTYNFLPIQVGPNNSSFLPGNIPTVTITVCAPGTTSCQTVPNILVDTGSSGLRIFKQALLNNAGVLTVNLPPEQSGGNPIGECATFGGFNTWGPVETAAAVMGGEPAVTVPIQVIDASFGTASPPGACNSSLATAPGVHLDSNGILGISPDQLDTATNSYFTCQNGTCTSFSVPTAQAVQNPVFLLPQDNNGILVYLGAVPDGGAAQAYGALVLGIGTESNNDPNFISSGNPYLCVNAPSNVFFTTYNGAQLFPSAVDTGSPISLFQDSSITQCTPYAVTLYCPTPPVNRSATVSGSTGSQQKVDFLVGDGEALLGEGAVDDIAAPLAGLGDLEFDWGLPFFFGRSVFIAYGSSSSTVCGSGGITANTWGYAPLPQNAQAALTRILKEKNKSPFPTKQ